MFTTDEPSTEYPIEEQVVTTQNGHNIQNTRNTQNTHNELFKTTSNRPTEAPKSEKEYNNRGGSKKDSELSGAVIGLIVTVVVLAVIVIVLLIILKIRKNNKDDEDEFADHHQTKTEMLKDRTNRHATRPAIKPMVSSDPDDEGL